MRSNYLYILFTLCSMFTNAQVRPFLIDPGSNAGSIGSTIQYKLIRDEEKEIRNELNKLITEYSQRSIYIVTTQTLIDDVNSEVTSSLNRYTTLNQRNESLSTVFSYSTKKDNRKKLKIVLTMISNIRDELKKQDGFTVVYGEKLNLYQNSLQSLSDIHRIMDVVEEEIDKKNLIRQLLN